MNPAEKLREKINTLLFAYVDKVTISGSNDPVYKITDAILAAVAEFVKAVSINPNEGLYTDAVKEYQQRLLSGLVSDQQEGGK